MVLAARCRVKYEPASDYDSVYAAGVNLHLDMQSVFETFDRKEFERVVLPWLDNDECPQHDYASKYRTTVYGIEGLPPPR